MSITVKCKTKMSESLKLANKIGSFLFEQQYNELLTMPDYDVATLRKALEVLMNHVNRNK